MTISPIIFYVLGILFVVLTLEDGWKLPSSAVYAGLGIFVNIIGYNLSYGTADYVGLAYLPLAMIAILTLLLIWQGYKSIPKSTAWGDGDENEWRKEGKID